LGGGWRECVVPCFYYYCFYQYLFTLKNFKKMAKQKNQTPVPSDYKGNSWDIQKVGAILYSPFYVPASIATGGLRNAGLGAGALVILGAVGLAVYFGLAFAISKANPNKHIMKYAAILWSVLFIGSIIFILSKKNEEKGKPFTGGKLSTTQA
jgi:hypothetical protein